jgi:hypothetical protein
MKISNPGIVGFPIKVIVVPGELRERIPEYPADGAWALGVGLDLNQYARLLSIIFKA